MRCVLVSEEDSNHVVVRLRRSTGLVLPKMAVSLFDRNRLIGDDNVAGRGVVVLLWGGTLMGLEG